MYNGKSLSIMPWIALSLLWSLLIGGLAVGDIDEHEESIVDLALVEARASFSKEQVYREWAAGHGGVYVPISEATPANPHLTQVAERDILTPNGTRLTLINPAYMIRQVHDLSRKGYGIQGHLTSLKPLRPENGPDLWEEKALRRYEKTPGEEVFAVVSIGAERYLRAMFPLSVEGDCLKCHAHQGYKIGDQRGGISLTVPLAPYEMAYREARTSTIYSFGLVWSIGLMSLILTYLLTRRKFIDLESARLNLWLSECKYRQLFNEATYGIGLVEVESGTIVECNTALASIVGRSRSELIGQDQRVLQGQPGEQGEVQPLFRMPEPGAQGKLFEIGLLTKAGDARLVEVKTNLFNFDGRKLLQGLFHDVTETRRAQCQAIAREQRFRAIFEAAENVAFIVSEATREETILEFSPGAERIFGYAKEEIVGLPLSQLVASINPAETVYRQRKMREGGAGFSGEWQLKRKSGEEFFAMMTISPLLDDSGQVCAELSIGLDISQKRALENQLLQAQKMEALGTLAGGIAHDFNNILNIIFANAQLLRPQLPEESKGDEYLCGIIKATERATDLVKQILTFSRKAVEKRQPVVADTSIREALKLLEASIPKTIEIRQHISSDSGLLLADPTQLHQVLMNLCTNACQAMRNSGMLEIDLQPTTITGELAGRGADLTPGPYLLLRVKDNGPGMIQETREQIFDPFFTTKEPGEGTGMGLAVVHSIVKNHGGAILVDSEIGRGTTFSVYLPRYSGKKKSSGATRTEPLCGFEHILLVDDESDLVQLGQAMLESLGYRVTAFDSPGDALACFRQAPESFDLVVTDQTMPELTGDQLTTELLAIRHELPVIISTGYSETLDREEALAAGAKDLLQKPLTLDQLAQAIRTVLDGSAETSADGA